MPHSDRMSLVGYPAYRTRTVLGEHCTKWALRGHLVKKDKLQSTTTGRFKHLQWVGDESNKNITIINRLVKVGCQWQIGMIGKSGHALGSCRINQILCGNGDICDIVVCPARYVHKFEMLFNMMVHAF